MTGTGAPVTLAEGVQPRALAADANAVYWLTFTPLNRLAY